MKKGFLLALTLLILTSCGGGKPTGLTPNFTGNGYSVFAEQMSINTYRFTVVANDNHQGAIFTVYGLADESQIGNFDPNARQRLSHVADGNQPGDVFEVTFNNDDNIFIIYEDALVGGNFVYDTTNEMIHGTFR